MVHGKKIKDNDQVAKLIDQKMFSVNDKTILVTGATGRVGSTLAQALLEAGAKLVLLGSCTKKLEATSKKLISKNFERPVIKSFNLNSEAQIKSLLSDLDSSDFQVDGLVHCAMARPSQTSLTNYENTFEQSLLHNAHGSFLLWDGLAKMMSKGKGGSLVYIGSIYGKGSPDFDIYKGLQMGTEPDYVFIKEGMNGLNKFYANKYGAAKVRSNVIVLGGVFDNQPSKFVERYISKVPLRRMAEPSDVVGACLFLLSDASSYVTGTELFVDGGYHSR